MDVFFTFCTTLDAAITLLWSFKNKSLMPTKAGTPVRRRSSEKPIGFLSSSGRRHKDPLLQYFLQILCHCYPKTMTSSPISINLWCNGKLLFYQVIPSYVLSLLLYNRSAELLLVIILFVLHTNRLKYWRYCDTLTPGNYRCWEKITIWLLYLQ
jgi:hypothetical protein